MDCVKICTCMVSAINSILSINKASFLTFSYQHEEFFSLHGKSLEKSSGIFVELTLWGSIKILAYF